MSLLETRRQCVTACKLIHYVLDTQTVVSNTTWALANSFEK